MRMIHAIEIMSRNRDGKFQWTPQLVATLNAVGDLSVDELSSVDEILTAISNLDKEVKESIFSLKISFTDEFIDMMREEEAIVKKESQKIFFGFVFLILFLTIGTIVYSGTYGIEPDTIGKFMDFGLAILKMIAGIDNN